MSDSFWVNPQIREMKIVVLDDSSFSLKFINRILLQNGYVNIELFQDPVRAIVKIFATPPDLIIIDLILKEMTAIEVIRKLRQNKMTSLIPILVISSSQDKDLIRDCFELGVDDFIGKDKDRREILLRVNNALKREHFQKVLRYKQLQLENDIKLAAKMQFRLLPKTPFRFRNYQIETFFRPYNIASGDFYQIHKLTDDFLLVIANDVSGHGVGTTFVVMYLDHLVRNYLENNSVSSPDELQQLVVYANNQLESEYGIMGLFTASFVALFDFKQNKVSYIQASFPPVIIRKGDSIIEVEGKSSPPLAVFRDYNFKINTMPLDFDDFLIYSDGIYEIHDPESGEMLDIEGLKVQLSGLTQKSKLNPKSIYHRIAEKYRGNFEDDVTILMLRRMTDA